MSQFRNTVSGDDLLFATILAISVTTQSAEAGEKCTAVTEAWNTMSTAVKAEIREQIETVANDTILERLDRMPIEAWSIRGRLWRENWKCNYAEIRHTDWKKLVATAKHCVSNDFPEARSDVWSSHSFEDAQVNVRVSQKVQKILDAWNVPEYGEIITILWCDESECYRILWAWGLVYKNSAGAVNGIWVAEEDFKRIASRNDTSLLQGLSWSPAINSEWKAFWVVSATAQADYATDSSWICRPRKNAIAIAPLSIEWI